MMKFSQEKQLGDNLQTIANIRGSYLTSDQGSPIGWDIFSPDND